AMNSWVGAASTTRRSVAEVTGSVAMSFVLPEPGKDRKMIVGRHTPSVRRPTSDQHAARGAARRVWGQLLRWLGMPASNARTSVSRYRRWPPSVRIEVSFPALAHRVTV